MPSDTNCDTAPPAVKRTRRMARQPAPHADTQGSGPTDGTTPKPPVKQELVLALLRREGGASLAAISEATGWLPHSARAALTGLRKKGHAIESRKIGELTTYFLA